MSPELEVLREYIQEVCGGDDADKILDTAEQAHKGQTRRSGEPYIEHPVAVANIIKQYYPGERLLCTAALLHDALEDAIDNGNYKDEEELVDAIRGSYAESICGYCFCLKMWELMVLLKITPYNFILLMLA